MTASRSPTDREQFPWAQDFEGLWHLRADDEWVLAGEAVVQCRTLCGLGISSVHVSGYDPREGDMESDEGICLTCEASR